jgi:hypothetical protein
MPPGFEDDTMIVGSAIGGAEPAVAGAIRNAASATGANFEYLLATARVESGLNPSASAKTSSAQGLFQFIDRTWLSTLKQAGPSLGYGKYAAAIAQDHNGQLSVTDPQMRQKIMALRQDPAANAAMAGAFTRANAAQLSSQLGRSATEGELYIAHFLGANGASRLISLAAENPRASAAAAFPRAAQANSSIFYTSEGKARTASDVYATLAGRYATARAGIGTALASSQSVAPTQTQAVTRASKVNNVTPLSNVIAAASAANSAQARAVADGNVTRMSFQNLFSDGRSGPVSGVVRDLWTSRPHIAAALSGTTSAPQTTVPTASASVSATSTPATSAQTAAAVTPAQRIQNIFNELMSSLHT